MGLGTEKADNRHPSSTGTDLQPYLGRGANGELPTCPVDPQNSFSPSYTVNNVGTTPTCIIVTSTHVLPLN